MSAIADDRDREAFADLFDHFAPRVKAYMRRLGAEPAAADDLVQDVMLTVWRRAGQFDPSKAGVATWIFTIARNRRIDIIRRERRSPSYLRSRRGCCSWPISRTRPIASSRTSWTCPWAR